MNLSTVLHQTAMEYSTFAKVAKAKGKVEEAQTFYKKAFDLEQEAAINAMVDEKDINTQFVLKRSAAALAYKSGFYELALELVVNTLAENPPAYVITELKDIEELIKTATSKAPIEHLQINGKLTSANEQKREIEIEDLKTQRHYSIFVPSSEIKSIVKTFFSEIVNIQVTTNSEGFLILNKISGV